MDDLDIKAVRVALAAAVGGVPGLTAHPHWPGAIKPPAAVVTRRETTYTPAVDVGADVGLTVRLFLSISNAGASQNTVDDYLSPAGPLSLRDAIEADPTLDGTVDWVKVARAGEEGVVDVKGVSYVSADLIVEVG